LIGFFTCEFELTMTRSEIANYLGLADETISRLIARFKYKNLIQVQRKSIKIIARERMIEIAEGECSLDEV
jgi:CRP/FNR family transcriptional regulator, anaerobic regulatory protein